MFWTEATFDTTFWAMVEAPEAVATEVEVTVLTPLVK